MTTHNEESPAPEQASEAVQQRPGTDKTLTEAATPTAEGIVDVRDAGGNETSSKVSRADALTDQHTHALMMAQTASCTCLTKTPDPQYHDAACRYRLLAEVIDFVERCSSQPAAAPIAICNADTKRDPELRARVNAPLVAPADERAPDERPAPGYIASTKTISAVSAALAAVREYANGRVADQMNRAVNMLLDELGQARASSANETGADGAIALPHWFETFLTNVCEIPDRNSPEGEPDAVVATLDELRDCAVNAIEQCGSCEAPAQAAEPVAKVRVTHLGHQAELESYVARALPIGVHDLYAAPQPLAQAPYDGNHVENHCPECGQYDSECECSQADAQVGLTDELRAELEWCAAEGNCGPRTRSAIHRVLAARPGHPEPHVELEPGSPEWVRSMNERERQPEPRAEVTAAARDVLAERHRQVTAEGWTPERDDKYTKRELAYAASNYAASALKRGDPPLTWPWDKRWWKPTTPRRNLVKAGALILAEIERIDRAAARAGEAS